MIRVFLAVIAAVLLGAGGRATGPAVVELFTAQGCPQCPAGDELLVGLSQTEGVLALAFHVTSFDRLGWKDPFATDWATKRHEEYNRALGRANPYTPQMIVDGAVEVTAPRRAAVAEALKKRQRFGHRVLVTAALVENQLDVEVDPGPRGSRPATLWLIRYDGAYTTEVDRGENIGRKLVNTNMVTSFEPIGEWRGQALRVVVPVERPARGGIAVILQENNAGRILGAAKIAAPRGADRT